MSPFPLFLGATFTLVSGAGESASGQGSHEYLRMARAAFDASFQQGTSGVAKGTYREYQRARGTSNWTITTDATFDVALDRPKYRIALECRIDPLKCERRIIVYDGTAVFLNRFGKGIRPVGCEGEVFQPPPGDLPVEPRLAGFQWDPCRLFCTLMDLDAVVKNLGEKAIQAMELPSGDFTLEYRVRNSPSVRVVFDFPRKYAYHPSRGRIIGGDGKTRREYSATWKNDGGIWYVDSRSEDLALAEKDLRWEIALTSFRFENKIPPETFTLAALGLAPGARILDQRPKAPEQVHYVPYKDKELETRLDGMVAQLRSLPTVRPHTRGEGLPTRSRRVWVWGLNAALLIAIVGVVAIWRYRARAARRTPGSGSPP